MKRILKTWRILLLSGISQGALAVPPPLSHTECIGYYTLSTPGGIEHAFATFDQETGIHFGPPDFKYPTTLALRSKMLVETDLRQTDERQIQIDQTRSHSEAELQLLAQRLNQSQEYEKRLLLDRIERLEKDPKHEVDPNGHFRAQLKIEAQQIPFYQSYPALHAYGLQIEDGVQFYAQVGEHIVSAKRPLIGTPEQTIRTFLSHYHPRETYEIPKIPGVCLPEAFMDGETDTATIGTTIRLKDYPDIVVYLEAMDANGLSYTPADYINQHVDYAFQTTKAVIPVDKLRPLRTLTVDGYSGKGAFTQVVRDKKWSPTPEAPYTDWGYIAYIPGKPGGKPGESFNLVFTVERFAKFAKAPMSEAEFRDLVQRIAISIKRRPGAWVPK